MHQYAYEVKINGEHFCFISDHEKGFSEAYHKEEGDCRSFNLV